MEKINTDSNTIIGNVSVKFEYSKDDVVLDHIPVYKSDEEYERWKGKTFSELDENDLKRAFEMAFFDQIERPSEIECVVEIVERK